jgi:hypothetical protein
MAGFLNNLAWDASTRSKDIMGKDGFVSWGASERIRRRAIRLKP